MIRSAVVVELLCHLQMCGRWLMRRERNESVKRNSVKQLPSVRRPTPARNRLGSVSQAHKSPSSPAAPVKQSPAAARVQRPCTHLSSDDVTPFHAPAISRTTWARPHDPRRPRDAARLGTGPRQWDAGRCVDGPNFCAPPPSPPRFPLSDVPTVGTSYLRAHRPAGRGVAFFQRRQ